MTIGKEGDKGIGAKGWEEQECDEGGNEMIGIFGLMTDRRDRRDRRTGRQTERVYETSNDVFLWRTGLEWTGYKRASSLISHLFCFSCFDGAIRPRNTTTHLPSDGICSMLIRLYFCLLIRWTNPAQRLGLRSVCTCLFWLVSGEVLCCVMFVSFSSGEGGYEGQGAMVLVEAGHPSWSFSKCATIYHFVAGRGYGIHRID